MSDLRTAAQQALEAWDTYENGTMDHPLSGVMEALRAALEAQEEHDTDCHAQGVCQRSGYSIGAPKQDVPEAGCGNMAQQEPVASIYVTIGGAREFDDWRCPLPVGRNLLYTAPPVREPLTEDEIERLIQTYSGYGQDDFVSVTRAIERAHGIKGGDHE